MKKNTLVFGFAILFGASCSYASNSASEQLSENESELVSCIEKTKQLENGRWAYMGTIGRVDGKFRTYEAIFVNAQTAPDTWSSKAFGGDVEVDEANAEVYLSKRVGTRLIPVENGELKPDEAYDYLSCEGPDPEGRYEVRMEYKMPSSDGGYVTAKNLTWYSEHGSYYVEDIHDSTGRINSRRSGVMTPLNDTNASAGE